MSPIKLLGDHEGKRYFWYMSEGTFWIMEELK